MLCWYVDQTFLVDFERGLLTLTHPDAAVVTGAFSYTGRYVAQVC